MPAGWDSDSESLPSTQSSIDEDEVNRRITPYWPKFRSLIECRGFRLDTFRDVREFYDRYSEGQILHQLDSKKHIPGYPPTSGDHDDNALCRDAGLVSIVSNLCGSVHVLIPSR